MEDDRRSNDLDGEYGCRKAGLLFVINSYLALALGYQPLYRAAARRAHHALELPPNHHIIVLTGRVTQVSGGDGYFEGPDDTVFPPWDENAS